MSYINDHGVDPLDEDYNADANVHLSAAASDALSITSLPDGISLEPKPNTGKIYTRQESSYSHSEIDKRARNIFSKARFWT